MADYEENLQVPTSKNEEEIDFISGLPKFFADVGTLNSLMEMDVENEDEGFPFAVEIEEIPYTMAYAPTNEKVRSIAGKLRGLNGISEAKAFILIFERSVIGSADTSVRGAVCLMPDGNITGGAADQRLGENLGGLVGAMLRLRNLFFGTELGEKYHHIDTETQGILLREKDGKVSGEVVTGAKRPDLACIDILDFQNMFASQKPSVTARPYADEIARQFAFENMSFEKKEEAAEDGDIDAMNQMVQWYLNGYEEDDTSVPQDFEKAFYWAKKAAEAGDSTGMFNLGLFYSKGCGTNRDLAKGCEWMEKAYEAGDEDAKQLAELFRDALEYQKAAEAGDAAAQAILAKFYMASGGNLDQFGPQEDYKLCIEWAKKAAAQNEPSAFWILGLCYYHGRGVEEDRDLAMAYYARGTELGETDCAHNLGCAFIEGEYLWQDKKKGFELIKKAAEQGNALAMRSLGRCYQFGNGCAGDMGTANYWYEKALEVLDDSELAQKVELFKMLGDNNGFEDEYGDDFSDEEPYEDLSLVDTQHEGRAEWCEQLRKGMELTYKLIKDKNGDDAMELFYRGKSIGLLPHYVVDYVIDFLKKEKIAVFATVKSCIPKSQRGPRARSADVHVSLKIEALLPKLPGEKNEKNIKPKAESAAIPTGSSEKKEKTETVKKEKAAEKPKAKKKLDPEEENRARERSLMDKKFADLEKLEKEHSDWEKERDSIKKKRADFVKEKMSTERKNMEDGLKTQRDEKVASLEETIVEHRREKIAAESKLESLGFFKFGEKSAQKQIIEEKTRQIDYAEKLKATAEEEYRKGLSGITGRLNGKKKGFEAEAEKQFPLPAEPEQPSDRLFRSTKIYREILEVLSWGGTFTMEDIQDCVSSASGLSYDLLEHHMDALCYCGYVKSSWIGREKQYEKA